VESSTSPGSVECVANSQCEIGENPLWHPFERRLYWCDIPRGRLFAFDPSTRNYECCFESKTVGGFTIQADGSLLLFMEHGKVACWKNGELRNIVTGIENDGSPRFNDVIADPAGRVFCGTMSGRSGRGALYRLDLDGSIHRLVGEIGCSNGLAFSRDGRTLFHIDSFAYTVFRFEYDPRDGAISNRRVFVRFTKSDGMPDGATVDADGNFWTALWGGGCIAQLGADGAIKRRIPLPVKKVSSLTFAGVDYSEVYVTTARQEIRRQESSLEGNLFRVRPNVRGIPEFLSRVDLSGRCQ